MSSGAIALLLLALSRPSVYQIPIALRISTPIGSALVDLSQFKRDLNVLMKHPIAANQVIPCKVLLYFAVSGCPANRCRPIRKTLLLNRPQ